MDVLVSGRWTFPPTCCFTRVNASPAVRTIVDTIEEMVPGARSVSRGSDSRAHMCKTRVRFV